MKRTLSSFSFRAFLYSNYIFSFSTKCTHTIEYLYCLLNICYMFLRSLLHPQGKLLSHLKIICLQCLLQWSSYRAWNISCGLFYTIVYSYNTILACCYGL